jgi:hypothetical protein
MIDNHNIASEIVLYGNHNHGELVYEYCDIPVALMVADMLPI